MLQHKFHVITGLKHQFIMGRDFLVNNKAKIDFENKTLAIGPQIAVLTENQSKRQDIDLLASINRVVLQPRSVTYVRLKAPSKVKQNCLITPLENCDVLRDQPGLTAPRVLAKSSKSLLLPIYNETSKRFTIKKGNKLAYLEKVDHQELKEKKCEEVNEINKPEHDNRSEPVVKTSTQLSEATQEQLGQLLQDYAGLFAKNDRDLGTTDLTEVSLNTGDSAPIKQRPYRLPYSQWPMLEKHLNDLQQADIIRPSQSPWSSPILFVPRKDGGQPRMCVDYRKLNKVLVQNSYPLPNIQDLLASFKGASVYSVLDLKSGYYQLPLNPADREKTAFVCPFGLFEFNKLPFGLSTAPSAFQELMTKVLGNSLYVYALVYLDDIIIFSKDEEQHIKHLNAVFQKLQDAGLKLKASKTHLFQSEVGYLGHIVSGDGIRPDPAKISAIKNMRPPTTVREVRSFTGMASYYRSFIDNFSAIIQPITELTKKHVRFQWTDERQRAFEILKDKLTTAPVLAHPVLDQPYNLYTDSSGYAVGAVLTQTIEGQERPIQYLSKQLSGGQRKWPTIEREAYAIIYAVSKLRHFLYGSKFTVFCDHKPLRTLFTSEMKNCRVQRWAIMLEEYGANIEYKTGKSNVQADLLSRLHSDSYENPNDCLHELNVIDTSGMHGTPVFQRSIPDDNVVADDTPKATDFIDRLKQLQAADPEIQVMLEALEKGTKGLADEYTMQDGVLYHIANPVRYDMTHRLQLVVPSELQNEILEQAHDSEFGGGHMGQDKTYDKIRRRFYWKTVFKDTIEFVQNCKLCKARNMRKVRVPMQDMPLPNYPFEFVAIDTAGPFVEADDGSLYVITVIDHFSGWPECYATHDKTANTVARLLLEEFIPRHSCPRVILSDNGTEFVNAIVDILLKKLKIAHIRTSVAHAAANGRCERHHAVINDAVAKYAHRDHATWPKYLPAIMMAYRTAVNDSTRYSPFYVVYGRDPVLPMDTLLNPKYKYMGEEYVPTMLERLHIAFKEVQKNTYDARENNRERLARRAVIQDFDVGDAVFYYDKTVKTNECQKFALRWKPFYRIVQRVTPVSYKIADITTGREKIVHSENLRPAEPEHTWDVPRETTQHIISDADHERVTRVQPMRQAKLVGSPEGADLPPFIEEPDQRDTDSPEEVTDAAADDTSGTHNGAVEDLQSSDLQQGRTKRTNVELDDSSSDSDSEEMETDVSGPVHSYALRDRKARKLDPEFLYM